MAKRNTGSRVALRATQERTQRALPRGNGRSNNRTNGSRRAQQQQQQQRTRPPFLKASDIRQGDELVLIPGTVRAFNQGNFGPQLLVDVRVNGEGSIFTWGIGATKPNMKMLLQQLIEEKYEGSIRVRLAISPSNTAYIQVIDDYDQPDARQATQEPADDEIPF